MRHHAQVLIVLFAPILICGAMLTGDPGSPVPSFILKPGAYDVMWKQVDSVLAQGQPRTALSMVQKIYDQARAEKNQQQIVRSAAYRVALRAQLEDDGARLLMRDLEAEVRGATGVTRAVLESILATMYWHYYENNQWRINGRTQVGAEVTLDDPATWDARRFYERVRELFASSIRDREALRAAPAGQWEEILIHASHSRTYRPTMYDILAHRALEFFITDAASLPKPTQEFSFQGLEGLLPTEQFIAHRFVTPDSSDARFVAAVLYQDLLRAAVAGGKPAAIMDLDLARLGWARENCSDDLADTTYFQGVEDLYRRFERDTASTLAGHAIAAYLHERDDLVAAREICARELRRFPGSRGAADCAALMADIDRRSVTLQVEESVQPGAPFAIALRWRNVRTVHLRVVRASQRDDAYNYSPARWKDEDAWLAEMLERERVTEWTVDLPEEKDYKEHSATLRGPMLTPGTYLVFAGSDPRFTREGQTVGWVWLRVTRLALIEQNESDGGVTCWVLDARDGTPRSKVKVEIYTREWENGAYQRTLRDTKVTGADGRVTLPPSRRYGSVELTLKADGEDYDIGGFNPYERGKEQAQERTLFFTDRSIYRPGQTVYFKGIIIRSRPDSVEKTRVVEDRKTVVALYDVNGRKVQELSLRTNDHGSFTGTFTLPAGVLTGAMSIRNASGSATLRCEEYKRPRFEVTFEPLAGAYALGQRVTAAGRATAYAGAAVDGASVRWRVVRRARYPFWWWWWLPQPATPEKEIAHGTAVTDADGVFRVAFETVPDPSARKKDLPVFTYEVSADVTDINGETRSASTGLSAGYVSVVFAMDLPERCDRTDLRGVDVTAANLAGTPVEARARVTVERLRSPARTFRPRVLALGDRQLYGEEEWYRAFPEDAWKEEDRPDSWPVDARVAQKDIGTDKEGRARVALDRLEAGVYRVMLEATDRGGEKIELRRTLTVYDRDAKRPPASMHAGVLPLRAVCAPGERAEVLVASSLAPAQVLCRVEHRGKIVREEWLDLDDGQRVVSVPVGEQHRGGFGVHLSVFHSGRLMSETVPVQVAWTNKELRVETATFRDKLHPGAQEEWRLTVKGAKADAQAAELAAAMYDASLDAIAPHGWDGWYWPVFGLAGRIGTRTVGIRQAQFREDGWNRVVPGATQLYDRLNLFLLENRGYGLAYMLREGQGVAYSMSMSEPSAMAVQDAAASPRAKSEEDAGGERERKDKAGNEAARKPAAASIEGVAARKDFNETAFFFPQLATDDSGNVVLRFTMPEALTRWKLLCFAHTPDLRTGALERTAVTQKELMVLPNVPRFLREGDEVTLMAKITNMSDTALEGTAVLKLFDAVTMQPVDAEFSLGDAARAFSVDKGRSAVASWSLRVPDTRSAIVYRIVAKAGAFSDGEEAPLPVLPNRMLVTEAMPVWVRGGQKKSFSFDHLREASKSPTLRQERLTLEMTSQPAWYAVQALPYLMEFPYECAEQVFNRYYANSIAAHIVNSSPKIRRVFEQWKGTDALVSNLEKNQQLKNILLEETPWVMQAKDETARKQRIALLFDLNTMADRLDAALRLLERKQSGNGGWAWFEGMPESRYITQYILAGFGHLDRLGVSRGDARVKRMIERALTFADARMREDYDELKRRVKTLDPEKDWLGYDAIQYLYARSFFLDQRPVPKDCDEALTFWKDQARRHWLKRDLLPEGMIALGLQRFGDKSTPAAIVTSLRERALRSEEMGMYWKREHGWWWWQAPVETQALMVEVFDEVGHDADAVEELKIWLLRQKQVQDWGTTVATAEACYALLRRGSDLLAADQPVEVTMGGTRVDPKAMGATVEAGTGHYTVSWQRGEVSPKQAAVDLRNPNPGGIAWGGVYWQYFEQLDRITPHASPLDVEKELFRTVDTDRGKTLQRIDPSSPLRVGDLVTVRVTVRVDRDMEYVHFKDMRGAGLETVEQLSGCRWAGGLFYYQAPRDASVNFFFSRLPKGVHVLEYTLRASNAGRFANGISTIQCMYAPEFAAHTAGTVVVIREK